MSSTIFNTRMDFTQVSSSECFLCGAIKGGGVRHLLAGDLSYLSAYTSTDQPPFPAASVAFLESVANGERILDEDTKVPICWSGCPASTRLFTARAQANLENEAPIVDSPFDLGYMNYDPSQYEAMLAEKKQQVVDLLSAEGVPVPPEVGAIRSPQKHFRQRVRFGAYVTPDESNMYYLMWNKEGIPCHVVEHFPVASEIINLLLAPLKQQLLQRPALLTNLSAVHFLTSLSGEALISLFYDESKGLSTLRAQWIEQAECALSELRSQVSELRALSMIGNAKKVRFIVPEKAGTVTEELPVSIPLPGPSSGIAKIKLLYRFPFDGFSNPNAHVNISCLEWLCKVSYELNADSDLLELYCGSGNHTCAISRYYPKVLCVELNKSLCECAEQNLRLNGVTNVKVLAMHSETMARTLRRHGLYRDQSGTEYRFGTLLVDPPRGGLDPDTRSLMSHFNQVIYISCNPQSLARDLRGLCVRSEGNTRPFEVSRCTVLDHFAYSVGHVETAVLLQRRS